MKGCRYVVLKLRDTAQINDFPEGRQPEYGDQVDIEGRESDQGSDRGHQSAPGACNRSPALTEHMSDRTQKTIPGQGSIYIHDSQRIMPPHETEFVRGSANT